jgi:hypothetical protein
VQQFTLRRPDVQPRLGLTADTRRDFRDVYRPTTLAEVLGQPEAVGALRAFVADPFPTAFLLSGDTGTGKTSTALALAHDLGVNQAADFFHVRSGGADLAAFEEIARLLRFTPWCGWRLILIDEADQSTARARQLMLSMLETLPSRTVVVLTTNHAEKFDQRTLDRLVHLPFVADGPEAAAGAQALADAIWHAETGAEDGPDVATLPGVFEGGRVSLRRVAGAMQSLLRDGRRPLPAPVPLPELAPAAAFLEALAPICGGAPDDDTAEAPTPAPDFPEAEAAPEAPAPAKAKRKRRSKAEAAEARLDKLAAKDPRGFSLASGLPVADLSDPRAGDVLALHHATYSAFHRVRYVGSWNDASDPGVFVAPGLDRTEPALFWTPAEFAEDFAGATLVSRAPTPDPEPEAPAPEPEPTDDAPAPIAGGAPEATADTPRNGFLGAAAAEAPERPLADASMPIVAIGGKPYAYERLTGPDGARVVRLSKSDGTVYDVTDGPTGPDCSCPDFLRRHAGLPTAGCKHLRALRDLGMIAPAPAPMPASPPVGIFGTGHGIAIREPEPVGAPENTTIADAGAPALGLVSWLVVAFHGEPGADVALASNAAPGASWGLLWAIVELRDDRSEQEHPGPRGNGPEVAETPGISRVEQEHSPEAVFGKLEPRSRPGRLTLADLADAEAARFEARGNGAGRLFARALRQLAEDIRWTRATTPDEHEARMDLWSAWVDANEPEPSGCGR